MDHQRGREQGSSAILVSSVRWLQWLPPLLSLPKELPSSPLVKISPSEHPEIDMLPLEAPVLSWEVSHRGRRVVEASSDVVVPSSLLSELPACTAQLSGSGWKQWVQGYTSGGVVCAEAVRGV